MKSLSHPSNNASSTVGAVAFSPFLTLTDASIVSPLPLKVTVYSLDTTAIDTVAFKSPALTVIITLP